MKRRDYEVFYIFEMLAAAKKGVSRRKLRDKVSCNGIKYKVILDSLNEKLLLCDDGIGGYITTDTGRALLEQWQSLMSNLGLSDKLAYFC